MTATRPPGYDDRSAAPVEASRRGAHRARPKPIAAILPVIAGVAVVLLVIGAVYTVFGSSSDAPETNAAAKEASLSDTDTGADDGTGTDATAEATTGSKKNTSTKSSSGSSVDKTIPVIVLNSIEVSGLAASYQSTLEGKGWTVDRTGNSTSRDLATTKIYYEDADMAASAKAVRKALGGFGELSEDADVNAGSITVVLGQDSQ